MLLELALWLLGLTAIPLSLAVLELFFLGGELGSEPPAIDTTEPAPSRSGMELASAFVVVGPATSSANVCLYCSLAGLTEATQGGPDAVFYPFEAVVPATPVNLVFRGFVNLF